jgi:hypothetical protein
MEQLIVNIANPEKAQMLSEFLRSLDFVNSVQIREEKLSISQQEEDFFQLAGLWENRDLTTESIRQEAWKSEEKS